MRARVTFDSTLHKSAEMDPDELGDVGRFAKSAYDDPTSLGALQEELAED